MPTSNFVAVPPDSTGKKIRGKIFHDFVTTSFDEIVLSHLRYGEILTGTSSGTTCKFSSYSVELDMVHVHVFDVAGTILLGETITSVDGDVFILESYAELFSQSFQLSDRRNPDSFLRIDDSGSAYMRFREGDAILDAFGNLQISTTQVMKSYLFAESTLSKDFFPVIAGGATIAAAPEKSCIKLSATDSAGSSASYTSFIYFPYTPLQSNILSVALRIGDAGKDNVVRRWGLFDNNDGLYFELSGNNFSVNIKSSITNDVRTVNQSEFNQNQFSNQVTDDFVFEIDKFNLYWIDYQWQGVGGVRFGVFSPNGERITMHYFSNANLNLAPYMKRGSVPFRIEQFTTGLAPSSSEMFCSCAVVARQAPKLEYQGRKYVHASVGEIDIDNGLTPLFSLRPKILTNGVLNRATIIPDTFEINVDGSPVFLQAISNAGLTGANFVDFNESTLIDRDATGVAGGTVLEHLLFGTGFERRKLEETLDNTLQLVGDNIQPFVTFAATTVKAGSTAKLSYVVRWKEI